MDVVHLEIDDPRWREALGRLRHDFYHLPEYVSLDSEWNQAQPRAFLARTGDEELFIPYLLRRCEGLFPDSMDGDTVYDVVSPYGYPGLLLSDAAGRRQISPGRRCIVWATLCAKWSVFRVFPAAPPAE